jgi:hypothetical protein
MRELLSSGKHVLWLWLLLAGAAQARVLSAEVTRIDAGPVQAEQVSLRLEWPEGADAGHLLLTAGRLDMAVLGYSLRTFRWRCPLRRNDTGWVCEGEAEAEGWRRGSLRLRLDDDQRELRLRRNAGQLLVRQRDRQTGLAIESKALPVDWLQPLLALLWAEAGLTTGSLDTTLTLEFDDAGTRLNGRLAVSGLGFDTPDGRIAAAELDASGPLSMHWQGDRLTIDSELVMRGGQLLIDPLYVELPATDVSASLSAVSDGNGEWRLRRFHWRDPGAMVLDGSAHLQAQAATTLRALELKAEIPDLQQAHARYFEALLGALGGSGLAPTGALAGEVAFAPAQGWRVEADLADVAITDAAGRFEVDGATGHLAWTSATEVRTSDLGWRSAALYGIALGSAPVALTSSDGGVGLRAPLQVAALGGSLLLQRLAWRPATGNASPQFDLGLELVDLDLAQLSARFDWPDFTGRLGGVIPAVTYEDGVLRFDGGLEVALFDGRIDVGALRLERPFGIAPRLQADIALHQLNLQPLTSVFGFGEITGRLDGRIDGLQLLDWEAVAFDAVLRTSTTAPGPRRISQRAVSDLTSIGGGGIAGGIQASMLRMFDSFAYSRIGLSCRLSQGVCHMGGLDSSSAGYTIVEGAGLPRITVNGFERRVDWEVLVSRLRAVAAGQALRFDTP